MSELHFLLLYINKVNKFVSKLTDHVYARYRVLCVFDDSVVFSFEQQLFGEYYIWLQRLNRADVVEQQNFVIEQ